VDPAITFHGGLKRGSGGDAVYNQKGVGVFEVIEDLVSPIFV
jgi:hypothetical protein